MDLSFNKMETESSELIFCDKKMTVVDRAIDDIKSLTSSQNNNIDGLLFNVQNDIDYLLNQISRINIKYKIDITVINAQLTPHKYFTTIDVTRSLLRFIDFFTKLKNQLLESEVIKNQPQQNNTSKNKKDDTQKLEFKDFFNDLDITHINKIQSTFKDAEAKDLAMLIYRMTEENGLVEIKSNSKIKSRKHFIAALTGNNKKDMSYINRVLQNDIKDINGKIHNTNYFEVKMKLETILNTKVA